MEATIETAQVRRWKRYEKLKSIRHEWLENIPESWEKKRLSLLFDLMGSGTTPSTSNRQYYDGGEIPWVNTGDLNDGRVAKVHKCINDFALQEHSALKLYPKDTLLVALYGATIGKVGLLNEPSTINQACFAMGQPKNVVTRFILYWLIGNRVHIVAMSYGGGQPNISGETIRSLRVCVPPLDEQQVIAAFLDRETARIDALIERKEQLIALLEEKRQAVISHAVTKGLDPNAKMKDSGSEYFGMIPERWSMTKLRHFVPDNRQIMYGIVLPGPHVDGGVPIVKGGNCEPGKLKLELLSRTSHEIDSGYDRSRLREGDIVYSIRGSIGAAQIVPPSIDGANLTQDAARVSPTKDTNVRWLLYTMQSTPFFAKLDAGSVGSTIRGINIRDLKRADIPAVLPNEQKEIADYLDKITQKYDSLMLRIREGIRHLKEYRTALISAAVTGQIDVREEV